MNKEVIYFNEDNKLYYIFSTPICSHCNNFISSTALLKVIKKGNKFIKKFYCSSIKCIKEYKKIENSGQQMFPICIVEDNIKLNGKWKAVYDFNIFLNNSKLNTTESLIQSNKLIKEHCIKVIDNTVYAYKNKNRLLNAKIGNVTPQLRKLDEEVKNIDVFFNNIKNAVPLINYDLKQIKNEVD